MTIEINASPVTASNEPNDLIAFAVETGLSESNPQFSIKSAINYDDANRYEIGEGTLLIDATDWSLDYCMTK